MCVGMRETVRGPMNREAETGEAAARGLQEIAEHLVGRDPLLKPYRGALKRRLLRVLELEKRLTGGRMSLADFASGHEYFGLHRQGGELGPARVGPECDAHGPRRADDGLAGEEGLRPAAA